MTQVVERQETRMWKEDIGEPMTEKEVKARDLAIEAEIRAILAGTRPTEYKLIDNPEAIAKKHRAELEGLEKSKPEEVTLLRDNQRGNQSGEYLAQKEQEDLERKRQQILTEIESWAQAITESGDLGALKLLVHNLIYEHNNVDLKLDIAKKIIANTAEKEERKRLNQQWQIVRKYIQEFDKGIDAQQKTRFEQKTKAVALKVEQPKQEKASFFSFFQRKNQQRESTE